jgi:beta-glucosidase
MDVNTLLKEMTLKEKVGQLNQRLYGWHVYEKTENGIQLTDIFKNEVAKWDSLGFLYGVFRSDPWSGKNEKTGLNKEEALEVSHLIQKYIKEHTRLQIPVFLSEECPHGHQALESTTLPTNLSVGASWNPDLYAQVQAIVAEELREKGAHLSLISTLDVSRDPRWGRTEECFSEDPFLTSQFAVAAIKGLQGERHERIAPHKSLAVLKHFAAQGSVMGGHNAGPVSIGERELYDIHLLPMKYAIQAGAMLCMAAYNDLDGIPCHGNSQLLTDILRYEFGFSGAVMADGCALDRLLPLAGSHEHAAAWALSSGVDISLWDQVYPHLEEAVLQGILNEEVLDQAVYRVLKLKEKMGLFEDPHPTISLSCENDKKDLNLKLATESLVLVKNEGNVLPIKEVKKVAVIGPNANSLYNLLGDYTPYKAEGVGTTFLEGMKQVFDGQVGYAPGSLLTETLPDGINQALEVAKEADVITMVLGGCSTRDFLTTFDTNGAAISGSNAMTCGENMDLADISLPEPQLALVRALKTLNKPMVAMLVQGRPYSLTEIDPLVEGILIAGYPGEQGGLAMANVVTGNDVPSGKLAMSIPRSSQQLPVYYNYRHAAFKEDYIDESGKALYPFGHGLSYASFDIYALQVEVRQEVVVSGKIKNKSNIRAAEVIQLYVYRKNTRVIPRIKELKGFTKVWLAPHEETDFTIVLTEHELAEYVPGGGYQILPGHFDLLIEATDFSQTVKMR